MRNLIILSFAALLLFGCINPPPEANNTTSPPVLTTPGKASVPAGNLTPYSVSWGDNVSVMYALYVDGRLFDTNNATLANESGIYNPSRSYKPFNFTVEVGKGVIKGFVLSVIGMEEGETLAFSVRPENGYGPYDPGEVSVIPRYYEKNLTEVVPLAYFEERGMNVTNGTGYETPYGTVFVQDINEENVTLFYVLGKGFTVNGIPQKPIKSSNLTATIEFDLDLNKTYALPDPLTGERKVFLVTDKNETDITLDANSPLANKTLEFEVTMLKITTAKSAVIAPGQ